MDPATLAVVAHEWARSADDILTRRTKHYLHLSKDEKAAFRGWFERRLSDPLDDTLPG